MVLILSMAVFRLWNWYWGIIALITFTLIWHEPSDAPRYVWINVFIAIALLRVVPHTTLRKFVMAYRNLSLLALVIITVPFLVDEVRNGIYPQLEKPQQRFFRQPALLQQPAMELRDEAQKIMAPSSSAVISKMAEPADKMVRREKAKDKLAMLVDPNATLQTGPGLPDWNWRKVYLSWSGPSDQQQRTQLMLLSPTTNMMLNFMRVGFLLILLVLVFEFKFKKIYVKTAAKASIVFSFFFSAALLTPTGDSYAAFPDDKLLKELKQRLTRAPDCLPNCAAVLILVWSALCMRINLWLFRYRLMLTNGCQVRFLWMTNGCGRYTAAVMVCCG